MYTDSNVDQDLVKQEVEKQLKSMGLLGDEDARKPEPLTMRLGDKDYTFNSLQEAQDAINNAFTSVANNQAVLLQQIEEAQKAQKATGGDEPSFDKDKFLELIANNPIEAFNYVDSVRYGEDRVPPQVKEQLSRVPQLEQTITAYRFMQAHPEFVNTDENANLLRAVGAKLNIPIHTYEGLESAYTVARGYGLIGGGNTNEAPQNQNTQTMGRFSQQNTVPTPPAIQRGNTSIPDTDVESYLEGLSLEQLQGLMR
jgi:hypothetical protein